MNFISPNTKPIIHGDPAIFFIFYFFMAWPWHTSTYEEGRWGIVCIECQTPRYCLPQDERNAETQEEPWQDDDLLYNIKRFVRSPFFFNCPPQSLHPVIKPECVEHGYTLTHTGSLKAQRQLYQFLMNSPQSLFSDPWPCIIFFFPVHL